MVRYYKHDKSVNIYIYIYIYIYIIKVDGFNGFFRGEKMCLLTGT